MGRWWVETQYRAFLLVFHDLVVSAFKFGGNRRFFGADTANFARCRDCARAIRVLVVSDFPVADVKEIGTLRTCSNISLYPQRQAPPFPSRSSPQPFPAL